MSEQHPITGEETPAHDPGILPEGRRRRKKRRWPGCLAALLALALLIGGLWFGLNKGVEWVADRFGEPADYPGPGTGRVVFEVEPGDTAADMGRGLKEEGVVASVDAFLAEARAEPEAAGIQAGFYALKKEMAAEDALTVLLDPSNQVKSTVTVPEGLRVDDVVELLGEQTEFPADRWRKALEQDLGLPDYAGGNPEGYLFPATYEITPDDKPVDVLRRMVDRWRQAAEEADLEARAAELGYTPHEIMTVASLVEAESGPKYAAQVARVIYNRLESDATNGLLQLDATVNYAHDRDIGARTTEEDRQIDSPYNTYRYPGLPPGPIEAPGDAAIQAATHPAEGDWLYYVTVNLATGETKFAETLAEHNANVEELNEYCRTQSERC